MIIVASYLISDKLKKIHNVKVLSLKPYEKLDAPVSSHPDMLICAIDDCVFCYKDYYNINIDTFNSIEKKGYKIIKTDHICNKKYPYDIGLNVLIIGKRIFCNRNFTAKEIIEYCENNGYKIINVKQGYSACSTFVVDENNVITSDLGMQKVFEKEGINVVVVSNSDIILEGYNCGFIGGSGFLLDKCAYFFGEIDDKERYGNIIEFLDGLNIKTVILTENKLHDYGGVKIF